MACALPDEQIVLARKLKDEGVRQREIATRLGVSAPTVSRWLKPYKPSPGRLRREASLSRQKALKAAAGAKRRAGVEERAASLEAMRDERRNAPLFASSDVLYLLDSPSMGDVICEIEATRHTGRPGFPVRAMVGLVLVKRLYPVATWTRAVTTAAADTELRHGLATEGVPSHWACYRFDRDHGSRVVAALDVEAHARLEAREAEVLTLTLPEEPPPPPEPTLADLRSERLAREQAARDARRTLTDEEQSELATLVQAQNHELAQAYYGWSERPHRSQSVSAMASLDALLYDDGRDSLHERLLGSTPALDVAYIQAETATTISAAIGALDLDRIDRMDDASLGHLREKLREAGLATHGVQRKERARLRTPVPHRGDHSSGPTMQAVNRGSRKKRREKLGRHTRPHRKPRKPWQVRDKVVY